MSYNRKRVIFLDYDGVLNDPKYLTNLKSCEPKDQLDIQRIAILKRICDSTGAKVVLTSDWRHDKPTLQYLKHCGIPVIGCTPHCEGSNRDLEIFQWQQDKKYIGDFIILDDDNTYNQMYEGRLICTREGKTLGLQPKHFHYAIALFNQTLNAFATNDAIYATLLYLKEELDRIMWNINQEEYASPFANTGNHFSTDVFTVRAYDWDWDYSESDTPQPPNFVWRDFQITWYKWFGRGMDTNRQITYVELGKMLTDCLKSLHQFELEHDSW